MQDNFYVDNFNTDLFLSFKGKLFFFSTLYAACLSFLLTKLTDDTVNFSFYLLLLLTYLASYLLLAIF